MHERYKASTSISYSIHKMTPPQHQGSQASPMKGCVIAHLKSLVSCFFLQEMRQASMKVIMASHEQNNPLKELLASAMKMSLRKRDMSMFLLDKLILSQCRISKSHLRTCLLACLFIHTILLTITTFRKDGILIFNGYWIRTESIW